MRSLASYASKWDEGVVQVASIADPFPNYTAEENRGKALFFGQHDPATRGLCGSCHMRDNPLATFKSTVACKCGDLELAAGEYGVYYSITDDCKWQINFKAKDKDAQTMTLPLSDSEHASKRLMMCLYAGDNGGAGAYVAFGTQSCMLEFEPVKEKKS